MADLEAMSKGSPLSTVGWLQVTSRCVVTQNVKTEKSWGLREISIPDQCCSFLCAAPNRQSNGLALIAARYSLTFFCVAFSDRCRCSQHDIDRSGFGAGCSLHGICDNCGSHATYLNRD